MNTSINIRPRLAHFGSFLSASVLSLIVTASLIALMTHLVSTDFVAPIDNPLPDIPDVSWEDKKVTPLKRIDKPIREKLLDPPPSIPEIKTTKESPITLNPTPPITSQTGGNINMDFFSQDKPIATALVSPRYPREAMRKGVEGFVDVQFDVLQDGKTHNMSILNAQPEKIFNRAALSAVSRWKFEPKRIDGKPVTYRAMVKRVRFNIEK